nr:MAG: hypothetical protein E4H34_04765 [Hyphomicrobiales bacterium]
MLDHVHKAPARISGALALVVISPLLAGCDPSPSDRFPGPWVEERSMAINRVLGSQNISGCENLVYRPSDVSNGPLDPRGDFLVYCSADGANWTAYIASPGLTRDRALNGPFEIYADIAPP